MSLPASSARHTRSPGFLTGMRPKNVHPLFGSAQGDAEPEPEPLFGREPTTTTKLTWRPWPHRCPHRPP